jgi:pyrrolidone-carboxylate peptidase
MKKAIITGSETFGNYMTNPTKWLALSSDRKIVAGHEIRSLVFPTPMRIPEDAENPGEIIAREAEEFGADVIISFGLASEAKGFRIERSATNWMYNEKYALPYENNMPLDLSRPEKERITIDLSRWDIGAMRERFAQAGIPFNSEISDDPGQYSCNSWIYRTHLALKKANFPIPYLFVHLSCTEDAIELMPEFDRSKTLITGKDMIGALGIFLQSYK